MCPLYSSPRFANPQNVPSCCSSPPYCFLDHPSSEVSVAEVRRGPLSPFSESSIVPQSRVSRDCCPFSSNPGSRSGSPSLVILRHHPHNPKSHIRTQTSSPVTNWQTHSTSARPPGAGPLLTVLRRHTKCSRHEERQNGHRRPKATKTGTVIFINWFSYHISIYMFYHIC